MGNTGSGRKRSFPRRIGIFWRVLGEWGRWWKEDTKVNEKQVEAGDFRTN
jgi:hypothetical protein